MPSVGNIILLLALFFYPDSVVEFTEYISIREN